MALTLLCLNMRVIVGPALWAAGPGSACLVILTPVMGTDSVNKYLLNKYSTSHRIPTTDR